MKRYEHCLNVALKGIGYICELGWNLPDSEAKAAKLVNHLYELKCMLEVMRNNEDKYEDD